MGSVPGPLSRVPSRCTAPLADLREIDIRETMLSTGQRHHIRGQLTVVNHHHHFNEDLRKKKNTEKVVGGW